MSWPIPSWESLQATCLPSTENTWKLVPKLSHPTGAGIITQTLFWKRSSLRLPRSLERAWGLMAVSFRSPLHSQIRTWVPLICFCSFFLSSRSVGFKIQTPDMEARVALPVSLLGQSPHSAVGAPTRKVTSKTHRPPPIKVHLEPGELTSWGKSCFPH